MGLMMNKSYFSRDNRGKKLREEIIISKKSNTILVSCAMTGVYSGVANADHSKDEQLSPPRPTFKIH